MRELPQETSGCIVIKNLMTSGNLARGAVAGTLGGVLLGGFLKLVQNLTGKSVYTVLLNIDFWYEKPLPESIEFLIHLIVAILIGAGYAFLIEFFSLNNQSARILAAFLLTIPAVLLFFPLTHLAKKPVPAWNDWTAFLWWLAGHILFAVTMALLYRGSRK
ncbi:hypothetical protein [Metabacillus lacus]|nr:hypothetical protein [Metabacillus lacus]